MIPKSMPDRAPYIPRLLCRSSHSLKINTFNATFKNVRHFLGSIRLCMSMRGVFLPDTWIRVTGPQLLEKTSGPQSQSVVSCFLESLALPPYLSH